MLRRLLLASLLCALPSAAFAQMAIPPSNYGGCPTSQLFWKKAHVALVAAAQTSPTPWSIASQATFITATDTFICGMVADGNWQSMDEVFNFAPGFPWSQAVANLNMVRWGLSASPSLGKATAEYWDYSSGYVAWLSGQAGYNGVATGAGYVNTNLSLLINGRNWTTNSASYGLCDSANRTTATATSIVGAQSPTTSFTYFIPFYTTGSRTLAALNGVNTTAASATSYTTGQGQWTATRNGSLSTSTTQYLNGSANSSGSSASAASYGGLLWVATLNDTQTYFWAGKGLTAAQVGAIRTRWNTLLTALNVAHDGC